MQFDKLTVEGQTRTVILWIIVSVILYLVLFVLRRILALYLMLCEESICLELTPPANNDQPSLATSQLFTTLHGLGMARGFRDRLIGKRNIFSLEIVSTKDSGIRYIIRASQSKAEIIEHMIASYTPDTKVKVIDDYIVSGKSHVLEFKQREHFAYPLQNHDALANHDPIGYLTGSMTKLKPGELISFQLAICPTSNRRASSLNHKIMRNDDLSPLIGKSGSIFPKLASGLSRLLFGITDLFTEAYHGSSKESYSSSSKDLEYKKQVAKGIKPVRTLSYFEHELTESIHDKLEQPLFSANIRVLIQVKSKQDLLLRKQNVLSVLNLYTVPKNQRLVFRKVKSIMLGRYSRVQFIRRLPSLLKSHPSILSASELASLYHFPHSESARTDNVVKSLSKTLPAPISLKNGQTLDVVIGENRHHGVTTLIGLTASERERHIYIIGGTGNGKTTMLLYGIVQDIKNGKGIAVLDPHGDLAETILEHIPEERIKDVIYLNPDDLGRPIGINLLELDSKLTGDELLREKDLITESTISVLRKIFSEDDSGGHRIEYVLRNTIQTALTMEDPTLFTIFRLLNDAKFRRDAVRNLQDNDLKNFWRNELGKAGDFQRVKMAAGITAKIGRFLFSASAKRILEQEKSTIDFDNILDTGKILICNFSKGLLGEDTSALFGTTILAKLQVAALRRSRQKQVNRRPFYLYVDEFQNFATMSFVQMLSEARKYKLFLTMAEQSTSQQDEQRLVDIILANVGTVVAFRSGSPADERLILPLFSPLVTTGEIANLPAYSFYTRIAAIQPQEPMSGSTLLLEQQGNERIRKNVIEMSRNIYGKAMPKIATKQIPAKEIKKSPLTKKQHSMETIA